MPRQHQQHLDRGLAPDRVAPILWINTALILLSSLTMEVGCRHFFCEIDVMEE